MLPINTVVAHAPSSGDPCIVVSPSLAAGLGIGIASRAQSLGPGELENRFDLEQRIPNDGNSIARVHRL
jgi:hypothetical protein